MLTTPIVELIWSIIRPVLNKVPDLAINYDGISNSTVYQFIRAALYMVPMETVISILSITVALWVLRIFISFFRSLWAALPIV